MRAEWEDVPEGWCTPTAQEHVWEPGDMECRRCERPMEAD